MGWLLYLALVGSMVSYAGRAEGALQAGVRGFYHDRVGIPLAEAVRRAELVNNGSRITNGSPSPLGAFPFAGGLLISLASGATSMCTCSLVSPTRAVTAAHCARDSSQRARTFTVVLGSTKIYSGGTRVTTGEVRVHEQYNMRSLNNDIALLVLPAVSLSSTVSPISLPSGGLLQDNLVGRVAQAVGFGVTRDGGSVTRGQSLNNVTLNVISNEACQGVYGRNAVTPYKMCTSGAGGKNICFGDSGGPLVTTHEGKLVLIGVSSFVSAAGCESGAPGGFTRVTAFVPWIQSNL